MSLFDELKTTKDFFDWKKVEQDNDSFKYIGTLNNKKDYIKELKKLYKASSDEKILQDLDQKDLVITYTFMNNIQLSSIHIESSFSNTLTFQDEQSITIDDKEISYDKSISNEKVITNITFKN